MATVVGQGEVVWINYDSKEAIVKHDTDYLLQDQTMTIFHLGDSLVSIKEILEKIGREDIIEELVEQGILDL